MPLVNQNIDIIRGDAQVITVTVTVEGGGVQNLTGATCRLIVDTRVNPPDDTTQVAGLTKNGVITNATGGIVQFSFTSGETATIPSRVYYYAVRVTYDPNTSYTVAKGELGLKEFVG